MRIRTITAGAREEDLGRAATAAQHARTALQAAGYEVQSLRVTLSATGSNRCADFITVAQGAELQAIDAGFDYLTLGPVDGARLDELPGALGATQGLFASAQLTGPDGIVRREAIRGAAAAIVAIGASTEDGFNNLRFAALAGVGPGSPFFPASYHDAGAPWIAVGPEAAALAVEATQSDERRKTKDEGGDDLFVLRPSSFVSTALVHLTTLIEEHDARIGAALADLERETGVRYAGCDWSLAPHPEPAYSIGAAIEAIAGVPFGAWGTLAAVRGITAAIRAARATRLGFSGVMLPVLEDATLAQRNAEGRYTLRDLLAFSAVCGTGLDTIPLPGDTTPRQIEGVLEEVAALSSALGKPLTARLLPIPSLQARELTAFDFPYFVNTRAMRI